MNQKNLKILIVDDEEVVAEVLGKLIEVDGHKVAVTHEGKHALEAYQKEKFDIVFTDISMPEMNGIDLTQRLLELDRDAKIVAITGHVGTEEVEKVLNAGAKAFMKKPFSKKDIDQAIKEIIKMS
ncbi:MAG: response regulator [candidate division Zixibacteria bacterium]|nr:response regulator [candidate division Zixibacteria bacterium]